MSLQVPRIRVRGVPPGGLYQYDGQPRHLRRELRVREIIRFAFYLPHDHHELAEAVRHALEVYLQAVEPGPRTLNSVCLSSDEESPLSEDTWERVHRLLRSTRRYSFPEDYEPALRREIEKRSAERILLFTGGLGQHNGYEFEYRARIPWRNSSPGSVSLLFATLPLEFMEEQGSARVRELALEMASRLPFASGHAGLALKFYLPRMRTDALFRAEIARYPGFDLRGAWPHADRMGARVDGIHWLNFLANPVLSELGGVDELQCYLHSSETQVCALGEEHALISLGDAPAAGDSSRKQHLPAYRELARVLEPWLEPLPSEIQEEREWWYRFIL